MKALLATVACFAILASSHVASAGGGGTARAARARKGGVSLVGLKQRNSVNPAAPNGTIVVKATFAGPRAIDKVGRFVADVNQGYSTGSRHGGVIAKMKVKKSQVKVTVIALPQVKSQFLEHLSNFVEQP